MTPEIADLLKLAAYIIAGRVILQFLRGTVREVLFAALNLLVLQRVFFHGTGERLLIAFAAYVALILIQFATLRAFAKAGGAKPWIAFFTPILFLILVRFEPASLPTAPYAALLVGISYLAFRCSHLALEVRNGTVAMPTLWDYLSFAFFVPVMSVGPITPYSTFRQGFDATPPAIPPGRALLRILVGMVKYKFLGSLCFQLTYASFLLDDHYHPWPDLVVAAAFYYLFLYLNFSGFCDMAIGAAGLMRIPIIENFNNPFAARNMREFWNRWHISLSQYMRDVCFSPLSKYFARVLGPARVNHAIALTIMVVFLLIGIWHGTGWNYLAFGFLNGLGVVATHYYTIFLKERLGRDRFKAYNANPWILAAGRVITFCYFAFTLFFFANSPTQIAAVLSVMR